MSDTENNAPDSEESPAEATPSEAPIAEPETVEKSFDQLESELDDLRDRLLRAVADEQNTRKRAEKEIRDTREYAVTGFAKDMLDVADNLSRALAAVDESALNGASDAFKNLFDGITMTERALISKMERHGVTKIDPELGSAFDPHIHQAVAQIPSDQPNGAIAAVMQTGFTIGSRTLRAAMVAVSAGAPAGGGSEGSDSKPGDSVDVKA